MSRKPVHYMAVVIAFLLILSAGCISGKTAPSTQASDLASPDANVEVVTQVSSDVSPVAWPLPAGMRVVFVRQGQVWIYIGESGLRQLSTVGSVSAPRISDDGQVVVFKSNQDLYAVNADGTNERLILRPGDLNIPAISSDQVVIYQFDFSPGGHTLYFTLEAQFDLYRLEMDAPAIVQLLAPGQGGYFFFSPDGQWLALSQPGRVLLVRADGTEVREVLSLTPGVEVIYPSAESLVWMENSYGFYVIAMNVLWFVPVEGRTAQLAAFNAEAGAYALSPDGTRVAYFKTSTANLDQWELHFIDASTADMLFGAYNKSEIFKVDWTPDSQRFVLWMGDMSNPKPFLGRVGEQPASLTDQEFVDGLIWIDSNCFLFYSSGLRYGCIDQPSQLLDAQASNNELDLSY